MNGITDSIVAVLKKDILLELRGKESLSLMMFFSLLMLVIFHFTLDINRTEASSMAPGLLWVIFSFSGVLGMGRAAAAERDEDAYLNIVFSPASVGGFFIGKVLSNLLFLLIMEAVTIVLYAVLFDYEQLILLLPRIAPPILLGTVGFSIVGTFFSFISSATKYGETLLPFLYLPLVLPIIVGGVTSMEAVLGGKDVLEVGKWLRALAVFDVIYLTLSLLLFEQVLKD